MSFFFENNFRVFHIINIITNFGLVNIKILIINKAGSTPEFSINNNNIELSREEFATSNISTYISIIIDFYSVTHRIPIPTPKVKQFLVLLILIYNSGQRKYRNDKVTPYLMDNMKFSSSMDINTYLRKLADIKWITYNKKSKDFTLPELFRKIPLRKGDNDEPSFICSFEAILNA